MCVSTTHTLGGLSTIRVKLRGVCQRSGWWLIPLGLPAPLLFTNHSRFLEKKLSQTGVKPLFVFPPLQQGSSSQVLGPKPVELSTTTVISMIQANRLQVYVLKCVGLRLDSDIFTATVGLVLLILSKHGRPNIDNLQLSIFWEYAVKGIMLDLRVTKLNPWYTKHAKRILSSHDWVQGYSQTHTSISTANTSMCEFLGFLGLDAFTLKCVSSNDWLMICIRKCILDENAVWQSISATSICLQAALQANHNKWLASVHWSFVVVKQICATDSALVQWIAGALALVALGVLVRYKIKERAKKNKIFDRNLEELLREHGHAEAPIDSRTGSKVWGAGSRVVQYLSLQSPLHIEA